MPISSTDERGYGVLYQPESSLRLKPIPRSSGPEMAPVGWNLARSAAPSTTFLDHRRDRCLAATARHVSAGSRHEVKATRSPNAYRRRHLLVKSLLAVAPRV